MKTAAKRRPAPSTSMLDSFLADIAERWTDAESAKSALCDWLAEKGVGGAELLAVLNHLAAGVLLPYPEPRDPRFAATEFVVEANGDENQLLWERHSSESLLRERAGPGVIGLYGPPVQWEQDNRGTVVLVGAVWDRPVNLSCTWARLNGHLVLFCYSCSALADHTLVDRWLAEHCNPTWDRGARRAHCDAANFYRCLEHCRR